MTYISDECPVHSDCNEKQLKTTLSDIIRANQVRVVAIIYSIEAVFTIAYGLLVHFNLVKAKFHYTSWFGASSELAPNMFGASYGVMEFGFYQLAS